MVILPRDQACNTHKTGFIFLHFGQKQALGLWEITALAEQRVRLFFLTYAQLWRQRFLGEAEQLRPIYVVGPEFVRQSPEAFLHQPRWHILLRPIADQQLRSARWGSPWEGESKRGGQALTAAAPFEKWPNILHARLSWNPAE